MRVEAQYWFLQKFHNKLEVGLIGEVELQDGGNKFCRKFVVNTKRTPKT